MNAALQDFQKWFTKTPIDGDQSPREYINAQVKHCQARCNSNQECIDDCNAKRKRVHKQIYQTQTKFMHLVAKDCIDSEAQCYKQFEDNALLVQGELGTMIGAAFK